MKSQAVFLCNSYVLEENVRVNRRFVACFFGKLTQSGSYPVASRMVTAYLLSVLTLGPHCAEYWEEFDESDLHGELLVFLGGSLGTFWVI